MDTVLNPSGPGCYINDVILEEKDFMVDKHGILVECAYDTLNKRLKDYKSTPDTAKKNEYMMNAFKEFLSNLKS